MLPLVPRRSEPEVLMRPWISVSASQGQLPIQLQYTQFGQFPFLHATPYQKRLIPVYEQRPSRYRHSLLWLLIAACRSGASFLYFSFKTPRDSCHRLPRSLSRLTCVNVHPWRHNLRQDLSYQTKNSAAICNLKTCLLRSFQQTTSIIDNQGLLTHSPVLPLVAHPPPTFATATISKAR